MKQGTKSAISFLLLAFTAAGAYNVMSDNTEVEKLAQETACRGLGKECRAQKTMIEKNPIAQTFEMVVERRQVTVRCSRALVFAGDYACTAGPLR